jgi:hypothetical protein
MSYLKFGNVPFTETYEVHRDDTGMVRIVKCIVFKDTPYEGWGYAIRAAGETQPPHIGLNIALGRALKAAQTGEHSSPVLSPEAIQTQREVYREFLFKSFFKGGSL